MVPAFKAKARPITNEDVHNFHLTYELADKALVCPLS